MPEDRFDELMEAMVARGGAHAERFFIKHSLGAAYDSVGNGWGIQKHINAALLEAERQRRKEVVLADARRSYLGEPLLMAPQNKVRASATRLPRPDVLFIPHASADASLAEALTEMIQLGAGVDASRIRCTSLDGMKVPAGVRDYVTFLRDEIVQAKVVMPLITPAFFDSPVCLVELGATWGSDVTIFPVLAPTIAFAVVERAIGKLQCGRIDDAGWLAELFDLLKAEFDLDSSTSKWNKQQARFLGGLPALLRSLPKASRVDASVYADLIRERDSLASKVTQQEETIARLKAAKGNRQVDEVPVPTSEQATFDECLEEARDALSDLPTVVRWCLYAAVGRNDAFYDESGRWSEELRQSEQDDLIRLDQDEGGYVLNRNDPGIEAALVALEGVFSNWSEEFQQSFRATHKKNFSANSEPVWRVLGLIS